VRVSTDGHTHTHTHTRTDAKRFYYLMLYAIAMGQIKTTTKHVATMMAAT